MESNFRNALITPHQWATKQKLALYTCVDGNLKVALIFTGSDVTSMYYKMRPIFFPIILLQ